MKKRYTENDLREALLKAVAACGRPSVFADAHEISRQYLSDVLHGRREIGPAIYKALGFERVVEYVRIQ